MTDARLHFPATHRNREVIANALVGRLPASGLVLEIASGSGEHGVFLARRFPALEWQPSDIEAEHIASKDAHVQHEALTNVRSAIELDTQREPWPVERADAVFCANMVHIAPFAACEGLFRGVGRLLPSGGPFLLYGPFRLSGSFTAPSNEAFDHSLRSRNPSWGVRDVDDLDRLASDNCLVRRETVAMPANNHLLVFEKHP